MLVLTNMYEREQAKHKTPLTQNGESYLAFLFFDGCDRLGGWLAHRSSGLELAIPAAAGSEVAPSAAFAT
jgi:hypothetical protein